MSTMTKSLHTVTAVTRVAQLIATASPPQTAEQLAAAALSVLGYDVEEFGATDPTVAACVKAIRKSGCARMIVSVIGDRRTSTPLHAA